MESRINGLKLWQNKNIFAKSTFYFPSRKTVFPSFPCSFVLPVVLNSYQQDVGRNVVLHFQVWSLKCPMMSSTCFFLFRLIILNGSWTEDAKMMEPLMEEIQIPKLLGGGENT